jgi:hypothetical protein
VTKSDAGLPGYCLPVWRERTDNDLDLVEARLRVEDIRRGMPIAVVQADIVEPVDLQAAPTGRWPLANSPGGVKLIDEDVALVTLHAQRVWAERARPIVIRRKYLPLVFDRVREGLPGIHAALTLLSCVRIPDSQRTRTQESDLRHTVVK